VGWTTEADETMTLLAALVLVLCYAHAECLSMVASRRAVVVSALAAWPLDARSAEPEPIPVCDAECMAARVARKQELLRKQDLRGKADAKVMFGGAFQAGKREVQQSSSISPKVPVIGEFLFPNDVGGVNLQSGGKSASTPQQ